MSKNNRLMIISIISAILIFVIMVYYFCVGEQIGTDMAVHAQAALDLRTIKELGIFQAVHNTKYMAMWNYPIWHISYLLFHGIVRSQEFALGLNNALYITGTYLITIGVFNRYIEKGIKKRNPYISVILAIIMIFVGPLYWSIISNDYYLGQFTANPWHNPTIIAIKPFAIIIFYMYYEFTLKNSTWSNKKKYYMTTFLMILMSISAFAKPNFYQVFIPTMAAFCIISLYKNFKKSIQLCVCSFLIVLPVLMIMVVQFALAIRGAKGGIGIELFKVWHAYGEHLLGSLLLSILFPIIVLYSNRKKINRLLLLSWILFISALSQFCLFYLKRGYYTGDFIWGVYLATAILFITSIINFINQKNKSKIYLYGGSIILALHTLCGLIYWVGIYVKLDFRIPLFWFLE